MNDATAFPESTGRRDALRAGAALALGGIAAGCATATGINRAIPPVARVVQDRSQVAATAAAPGARMPLDAEEKPTYVAQERTPLAYSRADNLFWNDIMMEHAKFFVMLMPGAELAGPRRQAEEFQAAFARHLALAPSIVEDNFAAYNRQSIDMAKRIGEYKLTMRERQATGRMRSLVWPLFFEHTAREAHRFAQRLELYNRGQIEFDRREVVEFWSLTMGEHSAFIAHLLDPDEKLLISQASKLERSFLREGFRDVPGDEVLRAAHEVLDFKTIGEKGIRAGKIKSIIDPALAGHVRREAVRFIDELQRT
jgi:hypothetical protein